MTEPRGEVHVTIDHLVVRGLSAAETRQLVGELRAGLTAAFGATPAAAPQREPATSRRARELGRRTARHIAQAGGR